MVVRGRCCNPEGARSRLGDERPLLAPHRVRTRRPRSPQIGGCLYWWKTSKSVPLLPLAPLEAKRKTAEGEERKEESKQQRLF